MPNFVGRSIELKQLEKALEAVEGGVGRCVLVSGEAGIGKSRLIAEIRSRAAQSGFTILTGNCYEQDRFFPYAPLIDMLRPLTAQEMFTDMLEGLGARAAEIVKLLPELASQVSTAETSAHLDPELEKRHLLEALTSLFTQQPEAGRTVMIVEDLHWSDEASLEFLLHLVRRIGTFPILLILSYRDRDAQAGLVSLLARLDREPTCEEIGLEPLTRAELADLLAALLKQAQSPSAEFVDAIYRLSEGNPFYSEEICTSLIASGDVYYAHNQWRRKPLAEIELPDSVQRSVQVRLERLSQPARQLIDLVAVSGRSFDFPVLQSLTGLSDGELLALVKELIAAQLVIEESADQFAFRHALTREALYGRLLRRERNDLHGQMLRAIEEIHADSLEAHLEALAYHAFEAALWQEALDYAQRAGEKALALYAPHAAVEHFSRAVIAAERLSREADAAIYRRRGRAFDILGNFERAIEDYEMALNTAQSKGDQPEAWRATLDLGLLWASRDYERTGDYCRQALELAQAINDPMAIGQSLNRLGNWLMNSGKLQEARDYHREALAIFEGLNDRAGIAATLDLLAMTSNMLGDAAGTVGYYQRAIPILRQLNDRQTLASSLTMLSNYTLDEAMAREAIEISRAIEWRAGEAYALTYLGSLLAYRGDYGQGLSAAREGLELAQAIDHRLWQSWGYIILGLIYSELLALDEATRHLQRGLAMATEVGSNFMSNFSGGLLASTYIIQGRLDEASALLPERFGDEIQAADYGALKVSVELAHARQEISQAAELVERLAWPGMLNQTGAMAYFSGSILQLRAEIMTRLDRWEAAEADLQSALARYLEQGVKLGLWRIWLALGRLYQARDDFEQAENAFQAARTTIKELAATVADDDLRENFRQRANDLLPPGKPLSPPQAAKEEFGGLTRRERQVAAVVAQGLSNQEIADELVISLKTVEAHVSHILSKLGFSSRAQIAAWAVDKGLAPAPQDLDSLSSGG